MKLATFVSANGTAKIAAVDTKRGQLLDLDAAHVTVHGKSSPHFRNMLALIDAGPEGLRLAQSVSAEWPAAATLPLVGTKLLAPLTEPRQFRDCMAFELHLLNANKAAEARTGVKRKIADIWYKQPIYYKANRFSTNGHDGDVMWPTYSKHMDYELELAAVLGRGGRDIKNDDTALGHIFGYTIFNDFSARDAQLAEMAAQLGPAKGKDFDGGNAFGPWIVTSDEIGDPHALEMEARVNGERWGGGNSSTMHHKWPAILAHISNSETLHAGEVLGSGTVGTGCGLELGRQLKHGDIVELEIARIGILRNRVLMP
jgi:2-keto-4-pentenoate hydratase/2-oxohepta-3-ene-1,7-dioic acid hydratase in catechol pathway